MAQRNATLAPSTNSALPRHGSLQHCRASFFRSFELKSGADMTPQVAFAGPGEQDRAPAAQRRCHQRPSLFRCVDLCSDAVLICGPTSTTLHYQVFPSHQDQHPARQTYSCIFLGTDTAGAVRSHFRYCVDDDSIKTCHWTSASFYGSGYITRTFASRCGKGSVLPARVALPASLFVGLGICTIGLLLDVWPTPAVQSQTSSLLFGVDFCFIVAIQWWYWRQ